MKVSLLLLSAVLSQAAGPGGPTSGWTLDSRTATIRAVTGIPGALRLADPLALPSGIAAAEFSATGDLAVALTTDQLPHLIVINSLRSTPSVSDLGEVADDTRILALNQKGSAALVYSRSGQTVRFAAALDSKPSLSDVVSTAALAGPVTAGVLENSGACAVLGTGSIETLCADNSSRRVVPSSSFSVTALAIGNSDQDLWIADAAGKQVLRVAAYAQRSAAVVLASETDGLLNPIALAVLASGQVLAADADAQALFTIDPNGAAVQNFPLSVVPSQLRPLTDRSLLLLNDLSSLPFTLFASEGMRTYFVPAN